MGKFSTEPAWSSSALRWIGVELDHLIIPAVETAHSNIPEVSLHVQLDQPASLEIVEGQRIRQRLLPDDLCLTPGNWSGSITVLEPSRFLVVRLNEGFMQKALEVPSEVVREVILRRGFQDPQILHLCQALDAEARAGGSSGTLFAESLATALSARLVSNYAAGKFAAKNYSSKLPPRTLDRIQQFVTANLSEDVKLSDLAALAHLSPFYFSRLFRQTTGLSPHQYLIARRIEKAKELLIHSDSKIVEISRELGYDSQSHFSATFKRMVGAEPQLFRQERKNSRNGHREQDSAS